MWIRVSTIMPKISHDCHDSLAPCIIYWPQLLNTHTHSFQERKSEYSGIESAKSPSLSSFLHRLLYYIQGVMIQNGRSLQWLHLKTDYVLISILQITRTISKRRNVYLLISYFIIHGKAVYRTSEVYDTFVELCID